MRYFLASLCLLGPLLHVSTRCTAAASEFKMDGDYLIGGLFEIHDVSNPVHHSRPESIHCSSQSFLLPNYRMFQLMRNAVEEINNLPNLLPNVSLGYEIFDYCSVIQNFPEIFNLISVNGVVHAWGPSHRRWFNVSKLIAVVGPFTSTQALTIAPLFMVDFIPMVSYGSSSSVLSNKIKYPSFLRTVHSNKDAIEVIVNIVQHFGWRWVAFLYRDNDFGIDGFEMFVKLIESTDICLAYGKGLNDKTNYSQIFRQIEAQQINVIVVFAPKKNAEALIESAIEMNVTNKVWIADDGWSLNRRLPKEKGIRNIGTVLGLSQESVPIPGFRDFMYSSISNYRCEHEGQQTFCNQVCNCSNVTAEDIISADPSFSFPVYSAVYAIAHALHNVLKCRDDACNRTITVHPHMVLPELIKSNFTLLNQSVRFDENGDPQFGSYTIVFWNSSGEAEDVGFYKFGSSSDLFINSTKIKWYTGGEAPASLCSPECPAGYIKKPDNTYKCCFTCEICLNGTYVNITEDPYRCVECKKTEWSTEGSTSCSLRVVEYIPFTDSAAILLMVGAWVLVGLTLAMSALFAVNYNTPVVRSAGGPMCFLILGCLSLCSVSVFFYFDQPTVSFCILRFLPFTLFYTVCIACFVVRSFQIVCIFKIAAKFPKLHSWWMKYHGQWLVITVIFVLQVLLLLVGYVYGPPAPYNETLWYPDKIILSCDLSVTPNSGSMVLLLFLCKLCFIFSYMGKDLPKNYNEAKAITFCLLLLILTWIFFATQYLLYRGRYIQTLNAVAVLSSLYSFLLWYFLPKCYIIIFQPDKNTQKYFQGLIQNYTKTISQ